MEYQRSRGMFLRFGIAGQPLSHGPIVLRSPVRERSAHGGRVLWATGCDAHAGTRRVQTVASTSSHAFSSQIWPFRLQIWTKGVLVEHRAPVVRRCNPALFRSKTDWTLLHRIAPLPEKAKSEVPKSEKRKAKYRKAQSEVRKRAHASLRG